MTADSAMTPRRSDYPTSRLRVRLREGRVLEAEAGVIRGDAENPISEDEVIDKFESLAEPVVGAARAERIVAAVLSLEDVKNVAQLGRLLSRGA